MELGKQGVAPLVSLTPVPSFPFYLQWVIRHHHGAPHMRYRAAVVSEAFFGILELAADNVDEWIQGDYNAGLESIQVVDRDHPRQRVPLVALQHFVVGLNVRLRNIVFPEHVAIQVGIFVAGT